MLNPRHRIYPEDILNHIAVEISTLVLALIYTPCTMCYGLIVLLWHSLDVIFNYQSP